MPKFKVGDRVYFPACGVGVYTAAVAVGGVIYPITVIDSSFTADGREIQDRVNPTIFHATPENQSKLEALYGVKFEYAPKPVPVGSDLTRWLLKKYGKAVMCYVDDVSDDDAVKDGVLRLVVGTTDINGFFVSAGLAWRYAVPIPNDTGFTTAADYVAD